MATITGTSGNDVLSSSTSGTILQGGLGDDTYIVGNSGVTVSEAAGAGVDEIQTTLATFSMASFANVERLTYTGSAAFNGTGNAGNNVITGGDGNDTLNGGVGADQLIGGSGLDVASYADASSAVSINLASGVHTGFAAGDTYDGIETIVGSNYNDTFAGDANGNCFNGGNGTDTIDYSGSSAAVSVNLTTAAVSGGDAQGDTLISIEKVIGSAYDDTLSSTTAGHVLQGGAGDDLYLLNVSGVTVSEAVGGGSDEIQTTLATFSLGGYANVERLTYTGAAAFTGTGNAGDNVITGGGGDDVLSGGAGADEFHGGAGFDTVSYADSAVGVTLNFATGLFSGIASGDSYFDIERIVGSNKGDVFIENGDSHDFGASGGYDIVSYEAAGAGITIDLATGVRSDIAIGDVLTNVEVIQGSAFDDTFVGDSAANNFMGGAGADLIDGGSGSDGAWYLGSTAAVEIDLLAGTQAGGDGDDSIFGGLGADFAIVESAAGQQDKLHGEDGDDHIETARNDGGSEAYGDAGNDTISVKHGRAFGGLGDDTLFVTGLGEGDGGAGEDHLTVSGGGKAYGGTGHDNLTGNGTAGYELHGDSGCDNFLLYGQGKADGGEDGDAYNILSTTAFVDVQDSGTQGDDGLYLWNVNTRAQLDWRVDGADLYLNALNDAYSGVRLVGWLAPDNGHFIEHIYTADFVSVTGLP